MTLYKLEARKLFTVTIGTVRGLLEHMSDIIDHSWKLLVLLGNSWYHEQMPGTGESRICSVMIRAVAP